MYTQKITLKCKGRIHEKLNSVQYIEDAIYYSMNYKLEFTCAFMLNLARSLKLRLISQSHCSR